MHVTLTLSLSTEERARNLVTAEVLKIASSPRSWIDPELIVASQPVQHWLQTTGQQPCPSGMSDCVYPDHRNPTGTRRHSFSEKNMAPFICPLRRKLFLQLFQEGSLVGSRCQGRYFSGTPLGTVHHLSCSSANCTPSTWPSGIHCCTAHPSLNGMCHSALLSTPGDFCITFFELPCLYCWIVSFSAHRASGGSISNNLTIMHLPLNMSTLAVSKECPGDRNSALSKGKCCHLEGNGVARCSA